MALEQNGDYWAIQCKFFDKNTTIDKPAVDSFLSTSSRKFTNTNNQTVEFAHRLWISTTNNWGTNAQEAIKNQQPPVTRISYTDLEQSAIDWQKLDAGNIGENARLTQKSLFPHQEVALNAVHEHFKTNDRGKIIMACGTGKTFTSLKIAENETKHYQNNSNTGGFVLFLVPSIALLGQTLREWMAEASQNINAICICSDANVSKKSAQNDDGDISTLDLALPASTNIENIIKQLEFIQNSENNNLTVVFSTYQSIEVIAKTQNELIKKQLTKAENQTENQTIESMGTSKNLNSFEALPFGEGLGGAFKNEFGAFRSSHTIFGIFDLIICDEAHRTTGITLNNEDASAFVRVHNNDFIKAKKRLYMTATPRLYGEDAKSKANRYGAELCSMDDKEIYGKEIYRIGFGEAVERGLLSDYKVLILTLKEEDVPQAVQDMIADDDEINTDDASKLIGCINAFSKQLIGDNTIAETDPTPMKRVVAFCSKIKDSQNITKTFNSLNNAYYNNLSKEKQEKIVSVAAQHVDGTMYAMAREEKLSWLKETVNQANQCRILTNARCLSEGVDVPSLDAVIFLSARDSQVDVVQSVGRVMRKAPNKKYGYIIIPVVVPSAISPDTVLDDNQRYKIIWSVLNALRAHDDRFNATINQIELNRKKPRAISVVSTPTGTGSGTDTQPNSDVQKAIEKKLALQFEQLQGVIFAKMVEKVGDRRYWEQWATDVALIAEKYIDRITILSKKTNYQPHFEAFLVGLQKNINPAISLEEAIEMLAQHLITKPVFEALFEGYSFVKSNPVSIAMQKMVDILENKVVENETDTLQKFYESVKKRASGIDNAEGKQKIIVELYDKFFKTAFPKMVEKLGIVYTPTEVVDFIVQSVDVVLQKEFNRNISDENIHILDPFTGTGTFITRLLQSGLIKTKDLKRKFTKEIHANEIVLLAYYIAAINIENAYHEIIEKEEETNSTEKTPAEYQPFNGIVLTDTFQLGENDNNNELFSKMFPENSERVLAQKKAPLRIIIGNPPYSVGQNSANDNAQNQEYEKLNRRIDETYAKASKANLNKSNYDSYMKAFRWSSDRLDKDGGIIAFVSNGSWLDGNSTDGFRKTIEKEFTAIYVFNLRGNQRTSGELSRKEGGKIFGSGSRTPISVTFLVKNPSITTDKATIYYFDIGDYLSREDKLQRIKELKSVENIEWQMLQPNTEGDWISQRNDAFAELVPLAPDKKFDFKTKSFFNTYVIGVATNRDAWVCNFSKNEIEKNMTQMIDYYNEQQKDFQIAKQENEKLDVESFINQDALQISWTRALKNGLANNIKHQFDEKYFRTSYYRPFCKQKLYFDKRFIESPGLSSQLFPNADLKNIVIGISGVGAQKPFSVLVSNHITDLQVVDKAQCFPLYYYEEREKMQGNLFDKSKTEYTRRDGISDFILGYARQLYGNTVMKEDIFYYVYGILHQQEYRTQFENDLKKMLPRIPLVALGKDFWLFSKAGRDLAGWHLDYETIEPSKETTVVFRATKNINYQIEKMRFGKKNGVVDKTVIDFNSEITVENIPLVAYAYVVNGKSAIEWVMERYQKTTHKDSQIKNNPNDWCAEVDNERYVLDLLLRVIRVSVETVAIVASLPALVLAGEKAEGNN